MSEISHKRFRKDISDTNISFNSPKKINQNKTLDNSNLSISGITDFEYFQLNLHKMKKLHPQLDSTDLELDVVMEPEYSEHEQQVIRNLEADSNSTNAGILSLLKSQKDTSFKIDKIDKKLATISTKVDINAKNIEIINENVSHHDRLILKNLESVNYMKQEKIDKEIFISGFEKVPNEATVIAELCSFYDYEVNIVQSFRIIPTNGGDGGFKAFVNVVFCTKSDQIKFLKTVREKGPINEARLAGIVKPSDVNGATSAAQAPTRELKISRRLTQENRDVIKELQELGNGKNYKIRFRNCFYEVQFVQGGRFITMPSTEHIKLYTEQ